MKRLATILNTTQDGVIVFNSQGRVSEANPSATNMLGYSEDKILILHISLFPESELVNRQVDITNDLTGLANTLNRRAIMETGERAYNQARRFKRPLAIMMIDADFFKKINDDYGHDSGDQVLVALADTIKKELRTSDFLSRFGGEEFLVILPEIGLPKAMDVANRLLEQVREIVVISPKKEPIYVTVSIGLSEIHDTSNELSDIIKKPMKRCSKPRLLAGIAQ